MPPLPPSSAAPTLPDDAEPESSTSPRPRPLEPKGRLVFLDVLRGFALFGVLLVNLPFAAHPMDWVLRPAGGAGAPLGDLSAWMLVRVLGETKFVSLFSLLFGIGLVLQVGRAEARGASSAFYLRRLLVLGVLGLLHGLLLWPGDILFPYALAGLLLYLLRRRPARSLLRISLLLFVIGIVLSAGVSLLDSGPGGQSLGGYELQERAMTEGPLSLTLQARALDYGLWLLLSSTISFNWHVMALFLLGAAWMKTGGPRREDRALQGRLGGIGLALGLALEASSVAILLGRDFEPGVPAALATLLHELGSLALAAGYAGGVAWIVHGGLLAALRGPFAAVGRTALTSYLGQSLVFNLLFPWFGLGLWGRLGRWQLIAVALVVYLAQMLVAVLWLRRFTMGPCEWLWRWATYGSRPLLRLAAVQPAPSPGSAEPT